MTKVLWGTKVQGTKVLWRTKVRGTKVLRGTNVLQGTKVQGTKVLGTKVLFYLAGNKSPGTKVRGSKVRGTKVLQPKKPIYYNLAFMGIGDLTKCNWHKIVGKIWFNYSQNWHLNSLLSLVVPWMEGSHYPQRKSANDKTYEGVTIEQYLDPLNPQC